MDSCAQISKEQIMELPTYKDSEVQKRIDEWTEYFQNKGLTKDKSLELALNACGLQCQLEPSDFGSIS